MTTLRLTFLQRLACKLFPSLHIDAPEPPGDCDPNNADVLVIRTECCLSFLDRLRVLFSGRLQVVTNTTTLVRIGESETASAAFPLPPRFMRL